MKTGQPLYAGWNFRPLFIVTLFFMLALSACTGAVRQPVTKAAPEKPRAMGDAMQVIRSVCGVSWRCVAEGPGNWLIEDILTLPSLSHNGENLIAPAARESPLAPAVKLEAAVEQATRSLARRGRYAALSHKEQLRHLAARIAEDYHAKNRSTLPDPLHELNNRGKRPYNLATGADQVTIASFSIDVVDSWPKEETLQLKINADLGDVEPTHVRLRCDQCDSFPTDGDRWQSFEFWDPSTIVVGRGELTVCLEVRAEPYFGNYANTALACDTIGTPLAATGEGIKVEAASATGGGGRTCFGAIGINCGPGNKEEKDFGHYCARHDPITEPKAVTCHINAGSWEYAECCTSGTGSTVESCSSRGEALSGRSDFCERRSGKVAERLLMGMTWIRKVDTSLAYADSTVNFDAYCARSGSIVHRDDVEKYCCSRSGEQLVEHLGDAFVGVRWACR